MQMMTLRVLRYILVWGPIIAINSMLVSMPITRILAVYYLLSQVAGAGSSKERERGRESNKVF